MREHAAARVTRKIVLIARREFTAAVRTKAFLLTLLLLPAIMAGGALLGAWAADAPDTRPRRVAVIDRTPGERLYRALADAAESRNATRLTDDAGRQVRPTYEFERIDPAPGSDADAVTRQRLDLSDRVRRDELLAYVDIGPDVLSPRVDWLRAIGTLGGLAGEASPSAPGAAISLTPEQQARAASAIFGDGASITYATARRTYLDVRLFVQQTLLLPIYQARIENAGLPTRRVLPLLIPPAVTDAPLYLPSADGGASPEPQAGQIVAFILPIVLSLLLFTVVLTGTSPMTTNVVEEKQLRIAEVLLGGATPFQLMAGKLLGGTGVAVTLAAIYLVGATFMAAYWGVLGYVTPTLIAWFVLYTVLASGLYGALFTAAGSAATNVKEAQNLIAPVTILIASPLVVFTKVLEDPNGWLPTAASFFPPATPMLMVARLAVPPGPPLWQPVLGAFGTLAATVAVVWAAGRVFRVGILTQGQGARPLELLRWVVRGE